MSLFLKPDFVILFTAVSLQVLGSHLGHVIAYNIALDDIICSLTFDQLRKNNEVKQHKAISLVQCAVQQAQI